MRLLNTQYPSLMPLCLSLPLLRPVFPLLDRDPVLRKDPTDLMARQPPLVPPSLLHPLFLPLVCLFLRRLDMLKECLNQMDRGKYLLCFSKRSRSHSPMSGVEWPTCSRSFLPRLRDPRLQPTTNSFSCNSNHNNVSNKLDNRCLPCLSSRTQ